MVNSLRDFFLGCPHLFKSSINVNFLGENEGDVSIEPTGEFDIVKKYCDGKCVIKERFLLSTRCGFDANISMNLSDIKRLQSVCAWILEQDKSGNLPKVCGGFLPVGIAVTKMPYLYESSIQGARMQIEFSLTSREQ